MKIFARTAGLPGAMTDTAGLREAQARRNFPSRTLRASRDFVRAPLSFCLPVRTDKGTMWTERNFRQIRKRPGRLPEGGGESLLREQRPASFLHPLRRIAMWKSVRRFGAGLVGIAAILTLGDQAVLSQQPAPAANPNVYVNPFATTGRFANTAGSARRSTRRPRAALVTVPCRPTPTRREPALARWPLPMPIPVWVTAR